MVGKARLLIGLAAAQIDEDTDRDRYMSPLEAKEYGLIDHVIGGDDAGFKVRLLRLPENLQINQIYMAFKWLPHCLLFMSSGPQGTILISSWGDTVHSSQWRMQRHAWLNPRGTRSPMHVWRRPAFLHSFCVC